MSRKTVVALGEFDGVHIGHRAVLREAMLYAFRCGAEPVVYTFENHPSEVIGTPVKLIYPPEVKRSLLSGLGIEPVFEKFTAELAALAPRDFVDSIFTRFDPECLVCGYDYTFGRGAQGNVELLKKLCADSGRDCVAVDSVELLGKPVSSTRIRAAIAAGDFKTANSLLGREYGYTGSVTPNRHIGTSIGFPTVNITVPSELVAPQKGVYAARLIIDGSELPCAAYYGDRPTVNGTQAFLEGHSLVPLPPLYGTTIELRLLRYIRPEVAFSSAQELRAQIERDTQRIQEYFDEIPE